jgi:transposase
MGKSVQYDESFKRNAVSLVDSGQAAVRVAEDLGVPVTSLYQWVSRYRQRPAKVRASNQSASTSELDALRRENELLRMERDILKKAVGIFSRPPR